MAIEPVSELRDTEREAVWDRFCAQFAFRPHMHSFPGIQEPTPSQTWSLDTLNDDPQYRKLDRLVETVEQGLTICTPTQASVLVMDWQHTSYRVRPDLMIKPGRTD